LGTTQIPSSTSHPLLVFLFAEFLWDLFQIWWSLKRTHVLLLLSSYCFLVFIVFSSSGIFSLGISEGREEHAMFDSMSLFSKVAE